MDTQYDLKEAEQVGKSHVENVWNLEQGVSLNGFIDVDIEGEVKSVQLTVRNGMTVEQAVHMTDVYIQSYRDLRKKYPRPNGKAEPKAEAIPEKTVNPDKPKRDYAKPVPVNELPEELNGTTVDVFVQDFDRFVIEPQLDEKASVQFFKDGLKWAVGGKINKWKHETVAQFLAPLGEIDPSKVGEYRVAGEQYWVTGSEYTKPDGSKGNYKNLKLVQAVF